MKDNQLVSKRTQNNELGIAFIGNMLYFVDNLQRQGKTIRNRQPKVGRNNQCPCGSGDKAKKCHPGWKRK